jgi:hypothetical protein
MGFLDPPPRARFRRGQKFSLSTKGLEVELEYREKIVASRSHVGRDSFDLARSEWAKLYTLEPDDGLYLAEVASGPVNLAQIIDALETCGKTSKDASAALGRLVDVGLVSPSA